MYILKVKEKGRAEKDEQDDSEHCIPAGNLYIRGKYLKKERSRSTRVHKFNILSADPPCTPNEIFNVFVDVSEDLAIEKETFRELLSRAGSFQLHTNVKFVHVMTSLFTFFNLLASVCFTLY